ncbi:MAG: acetyl-CoA carboxylase biotin carboxyl carrier protein [Chloroflexota bacterium]
MDDMAEIVREVARLMVSSGVREVDMQDANGRIRVHRRDGFLAHQPLELDTDTPAISSVAPSVVPITSPLVGTFYRAGKPDMAPLASAGTRVEDDSVVGIIEALQQLTEIEARATGSIVSVLATDGQPVEYGQVLFEVALDG